MSHPGGRDYGGCREEALAFRHSTLPMRSAQVAIVADSDRLLLENHTATTIARNALTATKAVGTATHVKILNLRSERINLALAYEPIQILQRPIMMPIFDITYLSLISITNVKRTCDAVLFKQRFKG